MQAVIFANKNGALRQTNKLVRQVKLCCEDADGRVLRRRIAHQILMSGRSTSRTRLEHERRLRRTLYSCDYDDMQMHLGSITGRIRTLAAGQNPHKAVQSTRSFHDGHNT